MSKERRVVDSVAILCGGGNCDYQGAANNLNNWRVANPNGDINIFSGLYIKRNGNIGLDD